MKRRSQAPSIAGKRPEIEENAVVAIENFLSLDECQRLLDASTCGEWTLSEVAHIGGRYRNAASGRRSDSLVLPAFGQRAASVLGRINRRLNRAFGIQVSHLEPWQMVRYRHGDTYDYHLDAGAWRRHPSGERHRTILIVLERPIRGGATHFRALNQTFLPEIGRLLVWKNLLPTGKCNHAMIHSGRPVWQGRKTILTTWEHERPYIDNALQGERNGKEE